MRKLLLILPLFVAILAFNSCSDDDITLPFTPPEELSLSFSGNLQVGDFTLADATVDVEANKEEAGYMDIHMQGVKFSDKMPVTLDITLSRVPCTETDGRLMFAAEDIVPLIAGKANSDYMFAFLSGWVNADATEITFAAQMAEDLAPHVAGMIFTYTANNGKADDEGEVVVPPTPGGMEHSFTGTLQVGDFTLNPANITVMVNVATSSVDVKMMGVRFSDKMPLFIDITLCNLACTNAGGKMVFSGENIVPLVDNQQATNYTFAIASGEFDMRTSALTFNAKMAEDLANYVAGKEFAYTGTLNK